MFDLKKKIYALCFDKTGTETEHRFLLNLYMNSSPHWKETKEHLPLFPPCG